MEHAYIVGEETEPAVPSNVPAVPGPFGHFSMQLHHEAQAAPIIDNDRRHDHHPLVQSQEYGFIEPCERVGLRITILLRPESATGPQAHSHEGAGELVDLNNANRAPKQLDSQIELHDN